MARFHMSLLPRCFASGTCGLHHVQGSHGFNMASSLANLSAASTAYAAYIGKQYSRNGTTNVVTIG